MWECVARNNPQASKSGALNFDEELYQEDEGEPFSREYVSLNRTHQTENADTAAPAQDASEPAQDTPEEEVTVSDAPSSDTIAEEEPGQE